MRIHARRQAGVDVVLRCIGGHRQDRQSRETRVGTDAPGRLQAIHARHLHVHHHHVEDLAAVAHALHARQAVLGQRHLRALGAQQFLGHLPVQRIVLDHQHAQPGQTRHALRHRHWRIDPGTPTPGPLQGFDHLARRHRLDQVIGERRRHVALRLAQQFALVGGQHQHQRRRGAHRAQLRRRGDAVDAGQAPIHQRGVEACALALGRDRARHRVLAAGDALHLPAAGAQRVGQHFAHQRTVIDHQHMPRARAAASSRRLAVGIQHQRQIEPEPAALAEHAVHLQLAAHHADQAPADHKAQAAAAEAAADRGLGLREAVEDALLLLGTDADAGVLHDHPQGHRLRLPLQQFNAQAHMPVLGELERVAGQVDQHLLQAQRIADHAIGDTAVELVHDLHFRPLMIAGQHHRQVAQQLLDAERMQVQLQLAGLDLGVVEDVVEQAQQRLAGLLRLAHVIVLARIQRGTLQQLQHAQHRVHRRADLVAHVGQERGFGLAGLVGARLGLAQILLGLQLRADVAVDADDPGDPPLCIAFGVCAGLDMPQAAVAALHPEHRVVDRPPLHRSLQAGLGYGDIVRVHLHPPIGITQAAFAQGRGPLVQVVHALVAFQRVVARGPGPDAEFGGIGGHRQLVVRAGQRLPLAIALGDVGDDTDHQAFAVHPHTAEADLDRERIAVLAQRLQFVGAVDAFRPRARRRRVGRHRRVQAGGRLGHQPAHVLTDDLLGAVPEYALAGAIDRAHLAARIEGHDGIDRRVQDRLGQGHAARQRALGGLTFADVQGDAQVAGEFALCGADRRDHQAHLAGRAVAAHIRPLADVGAIALGLFHEYAEAFHRIPEFCGQHRAAGGHLLGPMERSGSQRADHVLAAVAEQALGAGVEQSDGAVAVGGDDRHFRGGAQHAFEHRRAATQLGGPRRHLAFQGGVQGQDLRTYRLLLGDVAHRLGRTDRPALGVVDRRDADQHVDHASIGMPAHGLEIRHVLAAPDPPQYRLLLVHQFRRHDQLAQAPAHRLGLAEAEQLFGSAVPTGDHTLQGLADDAVGRALHHRDQIRLVAGNLPAPQVIAAQRERQRRRQHAEQRATQHRGVHRPARAGGDEGRAGDHVHPPVPPHHVAPQLGTRRLRERGLRHIAIERRRASIRVLVAQRQFDPLRIQIQRLHHLRHQQRRVGPAPQLA
ncbi:hypothetical protein NB723_003399 [Xanthomonas sacchari]|nr:hypothetical protein [Xanthomonas sacchari]